MSSNRFNPWKWKRKSGAAAAGWRRWLANQAKGRTGIIPRWLLNGYTTADSANVAGWLDGCGQGGYDGGFGDVNNAAVAAGGGDGTAVRHGGSQMYNSEGDRPRFELEREKEKVTDLLLADERTFRKLSPRRAPPLLQKQLAD